MPSTIQLHLDFIILIQSGFLLTMATAILALGRLEPKRHWGWLSLFGFAQTLGAWLEVIASDARTDTNFWLVQCMVRTGSFVALAIFAARHNPASGSHLGRPWPLIAVIGLAFALALWPAGENVLNCLPCSAGLVAGPWAGWVYWRLARQTRTRGRAMAMRLAAVALPAYCWVAAIPPEWLDAPDAFVALLRRGALLFLAFLLSFVVYADSAIEQQAGLPADEAATWRRRRYGCVIGVWLVLIAGWISAHIAGQRQDRAMREQMLTRATLGAAAVEAALVRDLRWGDDDLTQPAYQRLKRLMVAFHRANSDLRFALLAGLRDGRAFFLADSEPPESADYSPPGQLYAEADTAYLAAMASRRPFVQGPIRDRWGTWIFASVPVADLEPSAGVNFELNIAAADWEARIRAARLPIVLITLLICVLIIGFFQANERLRDSSVQIALSERRSSSLVEGSPDIVQMFDREGRSLAVNANGLRALGLAREAVLGRRFPELWPPAARPAIEDAVNATLAGRPTSFEADYRHPSGRLVTWRVATNPVRDISGRVCNFVAICVDLTDRKQAEKALHAAKDAAEAATRAKSEFLAVMSHELRTPLAGVIGVLDILRRDPAKHLQQKYTEVARDSAETLLHLLDDILDMAKIEAGKLTLERIPFRPRDEFRYLCEAAHLRADAKGLEFSSRFAADVPEVLVGDPIRLRQVLGNLQNNALKFTESGGVHVSITCAARTEHDVSLCLAVRDTGSGIAEETRARLFEKFEQADASTTRRYGGTGLGLSIVKSLAEAMDATITVESQLGHGSTFTFVVPLGIAPVGAVANPIASTPGPAPVSHRLHLLCAEDDNVNRLVAEALLTQLGHSVEFVENGQLAIERLRQTRYDAVLMDGRMPVMDGLRATRLIRDPATGVLDPEIFICAATANASEADRRQCLAHGMNDYVVKPLRHAALAAALNRAVEHLASRGIPLRGPKSSAPTPDSGGLSEAELLALMEEPVHEPHEPTPVNLPEGTLDVLLKIFQQDAPRRLAAMREAFDHGNAGGVASAAHAMKSAAHYIEAYRLSRLAADIEARAETEHLPALRPLIEALTVEFNSVVGRLATDAPLKLYP